MVHVDIDDMKLERLFGGAVISTARVISNNADNLSSYGCIGWMTVWGPRRYRHRSGSVRSGGASSRARFADIAVIDVGHLDGVPELSILLNVGVLLVADEDRRIIGIVNDEGEGLFIGDGIGTVSVTTTRTS